MYQSEHINELATALSKAQGVMSSASKDGLNPHFKNKYATLDSVWDAIRGPLSKNGLAIVQTVLTEGDMLMMHTTLLHTSGQWIRSVMPMIKNNASPQAIGSACTYIRRYSLAAITGATSGDDDDANEAEKHVKSQDTALVTEEEAEDIESMIPPEEAQYRGDLLAYFKVDSFLRMTTKQYQAALKSVKQRRSKMQQGENNGL